jgi:hypothetical protein
MAELTAVAVQTVSANGNVLFTDDIGFRNCNRRFVYHRPGTGTVSVRGLPGCNFTPLTVSFGANIAVPTGGTVGEISLALAADGEVIGSTERLFTPAAVDEYGNVTASAEILVPCWLPLSFSVVNTADQDILVQNASLIIKKA